MTVKMTFSLNDDTARRLNHTAQRLAKPKSQVVREAIEEYAARAEQLSDRERAAMLNAFDEHVPRIARRKAVEVDAELEAEREARRGGGRGTDPGPGVDSPGDAPGADSPQEARAAEEDESAP